MHHDFWHQRWQTKQIGFHLPETNPLLVAHFASLNLRPGARVFLPLCGKTLDMAWLLAQGYRVVGAELSPIAIEDLFKHLNLTPTITDWGDIRHYHVDNLELWGGDIFNVTPAMLGAVDAVYDRAALIALPEPMRSHYAQHVVNLSHRAPQLLIALEYDQSLQAGPPFSVHSDLIAQYYANNYVLHLLGEAEVIGGLKGGCAAIEKVWHLRPLR